MRLMRPSPLLDTAVVIVVGVLAVALLDALVPSLSHLLALTIGVTAAYACLRVLDRRAGVPDGSASPSRRTR